MSRKTYVTIMAGGIGSRFWPLSRADKPKQFLDVLGVGKSLLQLTVDRFATKFPLENIFIVTNSAYVEEVQQQIPSLKPEQIIAEPLRKNTAPCIAYSAFKFADLDPEGVMIVAPADHLILETDMFNQVLKTGIEFVEEKNALLTLGIQPTRPDTGYGYIQYHDDDDAVKKVKTFTEKPKVELAKTFLASGDFLWNAGIFIWSIRALIDGLEEHLPDLYEIFKDGEGSYNTEAETQFLDKAFRLCPNISIDNGLMERASNVYVIPSRFSWSDLGTWASLYNNKVKDPNQNVTSKGQVHLKDTEGCMVYVQGDKKLLLLQSVKDLIVIDTEDVLLVCDRDEEQKIKTAVTDLSNKGLSDYI